ncbi:MAG: 3-phosphoshikimate 1-carboxyvinyltransferase [Methanomicrobiales archaeon]|nr:3-phosphoshikimate 1-carboxyvinyltransferase [Methanomicrobiales archaeon]
MMVHIEKKEAVHAVFYAPPSKSETHRSYITAALAEGNSFISKPLQAEDTAITRNILEGWGIPFVDGGDGVRVEGKGGILRCVPEVRIQVRDSGTTMRFFTSLALLCAVPVILDGSTRMRERPLGPLVEALGVLGARTTYLGKAGYPPVKVSGSLRGGEVRLSGKGSSQYISSLLLVAPYAAEDIAVTCEEIPVSRSYIDTTLSIMHAFGAVYEREGYRYYRIQAGTSYRGSRYTVEGDFSSAAYFLAIPAICGGSVLVKGLSPSSTQGDRLFLEILAGMGCTIRWKEEGVEVFREGDLEGITINMSSSPDSVQTVCMVAACARSSTTITGVAHLRFKESDRLEATAEVLRQFGAKALVSDDAITVIPAPLHGGVIDPKNDHRTAMSAAILGLGIGDVTILQAECVNKSFPEFWSQLQKAGLL